MSAITTIFLLAFLPAPAAPEPTTYSIKIRDTQQGDVDDVTQEEKSKIELSINLGGEKDKAPVANASRYAYKEEVLEKAEEEQHPTKVKRTYSKARLTKDGKESTLPYEGKEVLIEKKGDNYVFSLDGKDLEGEDAEELDNEWNKERSDLKNEDLLPKKPVKLNETWKIDAGLLIKDLEKTDQLEGDAKNSKASGKLVKVYKKGEQLFGVMEIEFVLAVKSFKSEGMEYTTKDESKIEIHMVIDTAIDGTDSEATVKRTSKGELILDVPGSDISMKIDSTAKDYSKPAKK